MERGSADIPKQLPGGNLPACLAHALLCKATKVQCLRVQCTGNMQAVAAVTFPTATVDR